MSNLYCKLKYAPDLLDEWLEHENKTKRRISYLLTYQLSKKITEEKSLGIINTIEKRITEEEDFVKDAMLGALFALGQKNKALNEKCLLVMKNIGKIEVDYGDNSCEPIDVVKHLTSERIQKKFK